MRGHTQTDFLKNRVTDLEGTVGYLQEVVKELQDDLEDLMVQFSALTEGVEEEQPEDAKEQEQEAPKKDGEYLYKTQGGLKVMKLPGEISWIFWNW